MTTQQNEQSKFTKYLGTISGEDIETVNYWTEMERKNEVILRPSITEQIIVVFAPADSKLIPWDKQKEVPSSQLASSDTPDITIHQQNERGQLKASIIECLVGLDNYGVLADQIFALFIAEMERLKEEGPKDVDIDSASHLDKIMPVFTSYERAQGEVESVNHFNKQWRETIDAKIKEFKEMNDNLGITPYPPNLGIHPDYYPKPNHGYGTIAEQAWELGEEV